MLATGPAEVAAVTDGGEKECSRGRFCSALEIRRNGDGTVEWVPARTYRAFCDPCTTAIRSALPALPPAWALLRLWGLEPGRSGWARRTAPGSRLPLAGGADALMRAIPESLLSWEERVRDIAGLSDVDRHRARREFLADESDPLAPVRHRLALLKTSAGLMVEYLSTLLSLEAAPMFRPADEGLDLDDHGGADAGHEILRLRYKARAYLGFVTGRPEFFEGVPCKQCSEMGSLTRAPLPPKPEDEAYRSVCGKCGYLMTDAQHKAWVDWYAGWANTSGLACKRCQANRHAECAWDRCDCRASRHQGGRRGVV